MLRLIFAIVVGFALLLFSAQAQEPEPVGRLTLTETSPGAYQFEFDAVSDRSPYVVRYHAFRIGTDHGLGGDLLENATASFTLDLSLPLQGMTQEGCYRVGFEVRPTTADGTLNDLARGAGIDTRGCVDSSGVTTFPAHDSVIAPPPPPPSGVRVTPRDDLWMIEWADNSTDELSFFPRVIFLDRPWADGGSQISTMDLPEVPANQTAAYSLGTGGFFFADEPTEPTCGYAMVLVFASAPIARPCGPATRLFRHVSAAGRCRFRRLARDMRTCRDKFDASSCCWPRGWSRCLPASCYAACHSAHAAGNLTRCP